MARHEKLLASFEEVNIPGAPKVPLAAPVRPDWGKPLSWYGFLAPPGMQEPPLMRLYGEMAKALNAPERNRGLRADHQGGRSRA
ncbi:MAG: hypothetical protein A3G80_10325 [Betaproteobacteria bacterium RIFCSPLOWO2_12_FULL_62_13b]|nr:MAG: hypothetical protein A3G80_10325 [Betaproteobacteria bacterium RIFCSPLOWO2_12_FULL_62_13b]